MCVCVCVNWVINMLYAVSFSLCLSVNVCYHMIVRNSLCTSVTPITASSSGGIVMPTEALNAFLQDVNGHMVNIPTAYLGGPLPRDQLS